MTYETEGIRYAIADVFVDDVDESEESDFHTKKFGYSFKPDAELDCNISPGEWYKILSGEGGRLDAYASEAESKQATWFKLLFEITYVQTENYDYAGFEINVAIKLLGRIDSRRWTPEGLGLV